MGIFNVRITEDYTKRVIVKALNSFDIMTRQKIYTKGASDFKPIAGTLANQTVSIDAQKDVDISSVFTDPDIGNREVGLIDKLTITASSSNADQCGASVYENSSNVLQLKLTGYATGTPTITLTATDLSGNTATKAITVTVS